MPRQNVEAMSAALWRAGATPPKPPGYLSREAKKLWNEIVEARPADYFQPGSLELLAQFCTVSVAQRKATKVLELSPLDPELIKAVKDYAAVLNSTALKLRITIQTEVDRKAGKLDEKQPKVNRLIGGSTWQGGDEGPKRAN